MAGKKSTRPPDDIQPSLFGEPELPPACIFGPPATSRNDRALILEQIRRDVETLGMDPVFWMPSREFYEERIAATREEFRSLYPK